MKNTCKTPAALLLTFVLFLLWGCDSNIHFKNKMKGHRPWGIEGDYRLLVEKSDKAHYYGISFVHLGNCQYLIIGQDNDTLFRGEIRKRKKLYFLNEYNEEKGWWNINSFRIKGDSIYNFFNAINNSNDEVAEQGAFKDFVKDDDEYFINNTPKETYTAFKTIVAKEKGLYIEKVFPEKNVEPVRPAGGDDGNETPLSANNTTVPEGAWVSAYPNPNSGLLNIRTPQRNPSGIELYNITGAKVMESAYRNRLDISALPDGVYMLQVLDAQGAPLGYSKFVKQ